MDRVEVHRRIGIAHDIADVPVILVGAVDAERPVRTRQRGGMAETEAVEELVQRLLAYLTVQRRLTQVADPPVGDIVEPEERQGQRALAARQRARLRADIPLTQAARETLDV